MGSDPLKEGGNTDTAATAGGDHTELAVGVQQLKNTFAGMEVSNYNEIMAGAVMAIVPIIALFLILQKYIMTGMSKAAMK